MPIQLCMKLTDKRVRMRAVKLHASLLRTAAHAEARLDDPEQVFARSEWRALRLLVESFASDLEALL